MWRLEYKYKDVKIVERFESLATIRTSLSITSAHMEHSMGIERQGDTVHFTVDHKHGSDVFIAYQEAAPLDKPKHLYG